MDHADGFIFGKLGDEQSRAEYLRALHAGLAHRRNRTPRDPRPGEEVSVELRAGPRSPTGEPWLEVEGDGRRPLEPCGVEWDTLAWGYVRRFRGTIPAHPAGAVVRYRLGLGDEPADDGQTHAYVVDEADAPGWARDAVVYHVFVDRFFSGDEATWPARGAGPAEEYGGTLEGLRQKLDHVSELGATALWLSPIHPSPSYHRYDATDLFAVAPQLGTLDDFDRLVADAHARGIRLLLDFVPNHWSREHPTFVEATRDRSLTGTASSAGPTRTSPSSASGRCRASTTRIRTPAGTCSTRCASGSTAASTVTASTTRSVLMRTSGPTSGS